MQSVRRKSNGHACEARQFGDQMICGRCRLTWDTNDANPPACRTRAVTSRAEPEPPEEPGKMIAARLPEEPDAALLGAMVRTHRANLQRGNVAAMRAVYRVLLDEVSQ